MDRSRRHPSQTSHFRLRVSSLEQDFDFVTFQHSQHSPPSALLVFRVGAEGDYYFFRRVLGLTEFPELGMPEFSEPAWNRRSRNSGPIRGLFSVGRQLRHTALHNHRSSP